MSETTTKPKTSAAVRAVNFAKATVSERSKWMHVVNHMNHLGHWWAVATNGKLLSIHPLDPSEPYPGEDITIKLRGFWRESRGVSVVLHRTEMIDQLERCLDYSNAVHVTCEMARKEVWAEMPKGKKFKDMKPKEQDEWVECKNPIYFLPVVMVKTDRRHECGPQTTVEPWFPPGDRWVSVKNHEGGRRLRREITCRDVFGMEEFAFDPRYLLKILGKIKGDMVTLRFGASGYSPTEIHGDNEDYRHLLMPVRTQDTAERTVYVDG